MHRLQFCIVYVTPLLQCLGDQYPTPFEETHLEFKGAARPDYFRSWDATLAVKAATRSASYFPAALNTYILACRHGCEPAWNPKMVLGVHDATAIMHGICLPIVSHDIRHHTVKFVDTLRGSLAQVIQHHTERNCGWATCLDVKLQQLYDGAKSGTRLFYLATIILDANQLLQKAKNCQSTSAQLFTWDGVASYRDHASRKVVPAKQRK